MTLMFVHKNEGSTERWRDKWIFRGRVSDLSPASLQVMLITVGGIVLLWIADTFSVCRFRFRESNHFRQDFWQFSAMQNSGNCDTRRRGNWYLFASLCLQLLIFICPQEWLRNSGIVVLIWLLRGRFFDDSTALLQVMLIIVGDIVLFTIADIFLSADFDSGVQSFSAGFLAIFGD